MSSTTSSPPGEARPPVAASIPALRRAVSPPGVIDVRWAEQHIERSVGFAARRLETVHRLWSRLGEASEMGGREPLLLARVMGSAAPHPAQGLPAGAGTAGARSATPGDPTADGSHRGYGVAQPLPDSGIVHRAERRLHAPGVIDLGAPLQTITRTTSSVVQRSALLDRLTARATPAPTGVPLARSASTGWEQAPSAEDVPVPAARSFALRNGIVAGSSSGEPGGREESISSARGAAPIAARPDLAHEAVAPSSESPTISIESNPRSIIQRSTEDAPVANDATVPGGVQADAPPDIAVRGAGPDLELARTPAVRAFPIHAGALTGSSAGAGASPEQTASTPGVVPIATPQEHAHEAVARAATDVATPIGSNPPNIIQRSTEGAPAAPDATVAMGVQADAPPDIAVRGAEADLELARTPTVRAFPIHAGALAGSSEGARGSPEQTASTPGVAPIAAPREHTDEAVAHAAADVATPIGSNPPKIIQRSIEGAPAARDATFPGGVQADAPPDVAVHRADADLELARTPTVRAFPVHTGAPTGASEGAHGSLEQTASTPGVAPIAAPREHADEAIAHAATDVATPIGSNPPNIIQRSTEDAPAAPDATVAMGVQADAPPDIAVRGAEADLELARTPTVRAFPIHAGALAGSSQSAHGSPEQTASTPGVAPIAAPREHAHEAVAHAAADVAIPIGSTPPNIIQRSTEDAPVVSGAPAMVEPVFHSHARRTVARAAEDPGARIDANPQPLVWRHADRAAAAAAPGSVSRSAYDAVVMRAAETNDAGTRRTDHVATSLPVTTDGAEGWSSHVSPAAAAQLDVFALAGQVARILVRQFVAERERRGGFKW